MINGECMCRDSFVSKTQHLFSTLAKRSLNQGNSIHRLVMHVAVLISSWSRQGFCFSSVCMAKAAVPCRSTPAPGSVNFWFWCYFCFCSGWHHWWRGKLCSCCRDPERAWSLQDFCDGYSWAPVSRCSPSHRGILHWWGESVLQTAQWGMAPKFTNWCPSHGT